MTIKLTQSQDDNSFDDALQKGRLQVKKRVYNAAFKNFINDKYAEGIHFGNMSSNLEEILKNLSLDHLMVGVVKLPRLDASTLSVINEKYNEFSDFDLFESFECTLLAKDNVSSKDFKEGIEKFHTNFLELYNQKAHEEVMERDYENRLQIKKREIQEIVFFTVLAVIALILIYFFINR
ncbi:hypothetical protein KORDIASMS9_04001 [Kordia sp. SMS9]|uniref:hypothetical protein n=1 Tax=Kordia sp. SMS9 TaxID=2282170 RepID=UPI000E0DE04A|nr:hypothetical protein [Kordia sp. SMS9]AXG71744.1 hypothetical protein KORDIASMS9_04001 [Kordia sp. SMS9]